MDAGTCLCVFICECIQPHHQRVILSKAGCFLGVTHAIVGMSASRHTQVLRYRARKHIQMRKPYAHAQNGLQMKLCTLKQSMAALEMVEGRDSRDKEVRGDSQSHVNMPSHPSTRILLHMRTHSHGSNMMA